MSKKVLIVGGVAGGASAAARLRRVDENVEIIMFERGKYISFANCGLPYYIGGTIKDRDALLVQTPEAMRDRFNIDIRVENEVLKINRDKKEVEVKNLKTGEIYSESYDDLILSPGSSPLKPPIKGSDSQNIFTLWNIPDTDAIKGFIEKYRPRRAVVVGGGFIGIEMAENLHDLGMDVSLVEMLDQVMTPLDYEMAQIVHQHMAEKGVKLFLKDGVDYFEDYKGITTITLKSGKKINADIIILSIGIRPNSQLAKDAALPLSTRGGIIVDEYLRTEDPHIYAIGDAIAVEDFVTKEQTMVPLAGPANKQGRIVANNICGIEEKYKGTQGTSIAKVFDLTVASTGNNEKMLQKAGKQYNKDYKVTLVNPKSHAGYYPGALPMTLKVIFDMEGKVLGGQIVGYEGVDKRIDVLAATIRFGGTIYDLKELELAYAPPFSSAKDPVNMAGFTAENILKKDTELVLFNEMDSLDPQKTVIIDVREPIERELGYIPNSINIPVNSLRSKLKELDKEKEYIVYCAVGIRGYIAERILKQNGFKARNYAAGYAHYQSVFEKIDFTEVEGRDHLITEVEVEDSGDIREEVIKTVQLDACGLQCPGPIMQVYQKMNELNAGEILEVFATDPSFPKDAAAWCKKTGNTFIKSDKKDKAFRVFMKKGTGNELANQSPLVNSKDGKTMVVFSGELDKAIASFIIANGAAAMGKPVTMFFTFWGLNILRKSEKVNVSKSPIERMFGMMMPRGTTKLGLSKMNMMGMGAAMIKKVMKDKNVDSLEDLIKAAMKNGVKIVACTMSMDVMGIKKEELIDGIDYAGVASYLGDAEDSNVNLFI